MPAYQKLQKFMQLVNAANPKFEKWKKSSLRPLINVLNDINGTFTQAQQALAALPAAKATKYRKALYYLLGTYPGLAPFAASITFANLGKLNAARFTQTALPNSYNPDLPALNRVMPPSAFLNLTVEQYLFINPATGIVLIHMSDHDAGMDEIFEGETCLEHIKSVLRVAKKMGCDVCALFMKDDLPVLAALDTEYKAFKSHKKVTEVLEKKLHMGTTNQNFLTFLQKHPTVVVIGFDGTICVPANMFGSAEKAFDGNWARPLTTVANVVTSRAMIVSTGVLYTKYTQQPWGVLNHT